MKHALALLLVLSVALTPTPARAEKASAAHTVGGVVFLTGSLIVVAAVAIPLAVCNSRTETDFRGNVQTRNSCSDVPDSTKAAWIAGAGVGLTLAVLGGILYFETEPKQPKVAISPWATANGGGAVFVARF